MSNDYFVCQFLTRLRDTYLRFITTKPQRHPSTVKKKMTKKRTTNKNLKRRVSRICSGWDYIHYKSTVILSPSLPECV